MEEKQIIAAYKDAVERLGDQYVGLLADTLGKQVLQAPDAPAGMNDMIESFTLGEKEGKWAGRRFTVVFKNGVRASGNNTYVDVLIDGELYSLDIGDALCEIVNGKDYKIKHELKKVEEDLNWVLPFLMYLCGRLRELSPTILRRRAYRKLCSK